MMFQCAFALPLFSSGSNGKLTINLSSVAVEIEPEKLDLQSGFLLNIGTASPTFSLIIIQMDKQKKSEETVGSKFPDRIHHPTENDWLRCCRENVDSPLVVFVNQSWI
jgi:hypothetical protein